MSLVVVHSPKGGVGTTTVAANLAQAMARMGAEVAAVDLTGQDSLGLHLGSRPDPAGRSDGRADDQVVVIGGVHLLSVGQRRFADRNAADLLALTSEAETRVVVDIASGDSDALEQLLPQAALHLCVLTPEPASIALLPRIVQRATGRTRILLNMVDDRLRLRRDAAGFIQATFDEMLIGTVRRDEAVQEALAMIEPLSTHAPTSAALADMEALARSVAAMVERAPGASAAADPSASSGTRNVA